MMKGYGMLRFVHSLTHSFIHQLFPEPHPYPPPGSCLHRRHLPVHQNGSGASEARTKGKDICWAGQRQQAGVASAIRDCLTSSSPSSLRLGADLVS